MKMFVKHNYGKERKGIKYILYLVLKVLIGNG